MNEQILELVVIVICVSKTGKGKWRHIRANLSLREKEQNPAYDI
jgi:hypothetical protein